MERSDYQEYQEFKEFLRLKQQQNSQQIGRIAASETQRKAQQSDYGHDTLDYGTITEPHYDRQGNRE